MRKNLRVRHGVVHERSREDLAGVRVETDFLHKHLTDALRDAADDLTLEQERIQHDADIVDDEGHPCEVGDVGEIVFHTDKITPVGMFDGYYRDPDLTESAWHDGVYHTGDTAWKDEDGYFWFVGRKDDVIKSSGYRIGPFEVESALLEHPAVLECAVTAAPDPLRGQVVKATIVLAARYEACDALIIDLQEHVKEVTAPYKYPRVIEFVKELPKTISGKIRRIEIREQDRVD